MHCVLRIVRSSSVLETDSGEGATAGIGGIPSQVRSIGPAGSGEGAPEPPSLLHSLGLASHFEEITYSAAVGVAKPNPLIFRYALERLGVEPAVAVHIGDSAKEDVEGALAAGVDAVLLQRGGGADGISDLEAAVREVESSGSAV